MTGSVAAVVIIAIAVSILNRVERAVFTNPETVSSALELVKTAILILFPATILLTGMIRMSLGGSKD
ncbi:hypothetical protein BN1002_03643 [Bacillus sp. B-jedd]|nr:hypothetical protein BN1002_03643 [Bacillus sp. B-jedd]